MVIAAAAVATAAEQLAYLCSVFRIAKPQAALAAATWRSNSSSWGRGLVEV